MADWLKGEYSYRNRGHSDTIGAFMERLNLIARANALATDADRKKPGYHTIIVQK